MESFSVNNDGTTEAVESVPPSKRAATPRAQKALPTDRLKFEAQIDALRAFVIESNNGQKAVTSGDIAPRVGVVEATAGLNNAFFLDAGLIIRESKGRYKPTDTAIEFNRALGFDPEAAKAKLRGPLSQTWFFAAVRDQVAIGNGNATADRVIHMLAGKAGAVKEHQPKLEGLLEWLEYAGLITISDGKVEILKDADSASGGGSEGLTPPPRESKKVDPKPPAAPEPSGAGEGTTKETSVLEFSFSFSLTASDLAALEAEQIKALYAAVGEVMAAKAAITAATRK